MSYTTAKQTRELAARVKASGEQVGVTAHGEVGTRAEWLAKFRSHGAACEALGKAGFVRESGTGLWGVPA